MRRTRILLSILVFIIALFGLYYVCTNYETVVTFLNKTYKRITRKEVIIPTDTKNHREYNYLTVSETDNFEVKSIEDIKKVYYTVLNHGWDSFTFYCDIDYDNCLDDLKEIASSDAKDDAYITLINNYVNPFNSYNSFNTQVLDDEITISVDRVYTKDEIDRINDKIDVVLKDLKIDTSFITNEDIKKVHDYIINNTTYDEKYKTDEESPLSAKANGALLNNKAVCSGYTDAFALFLDRMNIPNFKVNSEEHIWNVVFFDNKWRHIDVTWDDDEINKNNNRNFYMISTNELFEKDKEEHNYNKELYDELK